MERFKEESKIDKIQLGKHFLYSLIKNTMEYIKLEKYTERYLAKEAAFENFMAVLFVRGSNHTIYRKIIEDFRTRYSMGHDEYPKTVQAAVDIMRQMKNTRNNIVRKNKYNNHNHIYNQENENSRNDSSFTQTSNRICFVVDPKITCWIHVL